MLYTLWLGGEAMPLREIEEKMINLQFWPPRT